MSQQDRVNLVGWAALITAIATLLGTFGISQIFPGIVKQIFNLDRTLTNDLQNNSQIVKLSASTNKKIESYISSQGKSITEENKRIVVEEATENYINDRDRDSSITESPTSSTQSMVSESKVSSLAWKDNADIYKGRLEQDFTFNCPQNGTIARFIYGTDIYTSNSSICTAAVHSGIITVKDGGLVTIRIKPREESYAGTFRNGVESDSRGKYDGSFIFVKE